MMNQRNLTMLVDFYELTMANGFLENGRGNEIVYFDMFFRKIPDKAGYAVMAGVQQLIEYVENLHFTEDDIKYLENKKIFSNEFLDYLKNFSFECDIWAVPEGTPIFPNEPIVTVKGPAIQAQFIETMILLTVYHQSLISSTSFSIVNAACGRPVMEFGSRRAQGYDGAVYGARAAYIGGCCGTACTISDRDYGVTALGTMAHSWVQLFDTELEAFRAYANSYPDSCTLLVDTYNTLKSGIPNAITVFKELENRGFKGKGVRIDSGDIAYLSKKARTMLDNAGLDYIQIVASNSLDEYLIRDLIVQGAKIDSFGVGERLVTSKSEPVFGGVYKLAAVERNGKIVPKIKISENTEKITNPGYKEVWRLFDNSTGMAIADVITLAGEVIDNTKPYTIFNPEQTYKRKIITDFTPKKLQVRIVEKGRCIYNMLPIDEIKEYCSQQLSYIWDEVKRFENPHQYYVDLSESLWELKKSMLDEYYK